MAAAVYLPPVNFGMVEEDLYRSGLPDRLNYPYLERLGLRRVVYLAPDEPPDLFKAFVDAQGIELVNVGAEARKAPWKPMSESTVIRALQAILDPAAYPLQIVCHLGRHRTGTVVGCLRKLQRWNLASIFDEYRRYAGSKVRMLNLQFVELFDTDLVSVPHEAARRLRIPAPRRP